MRFQKLRNADPDLENLDPLNVDTDIFQQPFLLSDSVSAKWVLDPTGSTTMIHNNNLHLLIINVISEYKTGYPAGIRKDR